MHALAAYVITWLVIASITTFGFLLIDPCGPDGEGRIQLAFMWLFRTFGTPARDIRKFVVDVDSLYLRRFYVSPRWLARFLERRSWWKWPTKIFLHHILRSDDDRHAHDHPWPFKSIILFGSYNERILSYWKKLPGGSWDPVFGTRLARPGSVLRNRATHTHKVEIIRPVWSLVFVWPAKRVWGFWTQDESTHEKPPLWVPWRKYLGIPEERDAEEDVIRRTPERTEDAITKKIPRADLGLEPAASVAASIERRAE